MLEEPVEEELWRAFVRLFGRRRFVSELSPFGFDIGGFLVLLGRAAIEYELLVGSEVDGNDDAIGCVARLLVSGARSGPELFRGFNAVPRACLLVAEYGAKHLGGLGEDFGGGLLSGCAIQHTTLVLGVYAKSERFVLSDRGPVVGGDVVLFTDLLIAEQSLFVSG